MTGEPHQLTYQRLYHRISCNHQKGPRQM